MACRVTALILAAGLSSRMKRFKPLLPLGGMTALERIVRTYREAGVENVRVVVGHRHEDLEPALARLGARSVLNPDYREGMFSSVVAGIATLGRETDAFFVHPVDLPLVRTATIIRLVRAYRHSRADLIYPTFLDRRGHPPLISGRHAQAIAGWRGEGGLRNSLDRWEPTAQDVPVIDEMVLRDMDTPDVYHILAERAERLNIPTPDECRALLMLYEVQEEVIRHCSEVARVAVEMGEQLNRAGCRLDLPLLTAAGLLHDLARHEPDHAMSGARILRSHGFPSTASLVASHMDLIVNESRPVREAGILYLADKLVCGDRRVSLQERFGPALERHAESPEIIEKVRGRLRAARIILQRMERVLGHPLADSWPGGLPEPLDHAG